MCFNLLKLFLLIQANLVSNPRWRQVTPTAQNHFLYIIILYTLALIDHVCFDRYIIYIYIYIYLFSFFLYLFMSYCFSVTCETCTYVNVYVYIIYRNKTYIIYKCKQLYIKISCICIYIYILKYNIEHASII